MESAELTSAGVAALKLVQLRKELQDRGIDSTGAKQDLVCLSLFLSFYVRYIAAILAAALCIIG